MHYKENKKKKLFKPIMEYYLVHFVILENTILQTLTSDTSMSMFEVYCCYFTGKLLV